MPCLSSYLIYIRCTYFSSNVPHTNDVVNDVFPTALKPRRATFLWTTCFPLNININSNSDIDRDDINKNGTVKKELIKLVLDKMKSMWVKLHNIKKEKWCVIFMVVFLRTLHKLGSQICKL